MGTTQLDIQVVDEFVRHFTGLFVEALDVIQLNLALEDFVVSEIAPRFKPHFVIVGSGPIWEEFDFG